MDTEIKYKDLLVFERVGFVDDDGDDDDDDGDDDSGDDDEGW